MLAVHGFAFGVRQTELLGLEAVAGLVQPKQGAGPGVGGGAQECPHLAVAVYGDVARYAAQQAGGVMADGPCVRIVTGYASIGHHHPDVAVGINGKASDRLPEGGSKGSEAFCAVAVHHRAPHRADEDAVAEAAKGRNVLVGSRMGQTESLDGGAVVAAETGIGAQPDKAVFVLQDVAHGIRGQTVLHGQVAAFGMQFGTNGQGKDGQAGQEQSP